MNLGAQHLFAFFDYRRDIGVVDLGLAFLHPEIGDAQVLILRKTLPVRGSF